MAFSEDDISSFIADEFNVVPGAEIVTPRAVERRTGGNAGFSHFNRATEKPVAAPDVRRCRRCRMNAEPNRVLCVRHAEIHLREQNARNRRRGIRPWRQGGPGRPPRAVRMDASYDYEVVLKKSVLADMLHERAALDRRIALARGELTQAQRVARTRNRCN